MKKPTVTLPCDFSADIWWVDEEEMTVKCDHNGVTGFLVKQDKVLPLGKCGEPFELGTECGCLTREEAIQILWEMQKSKQL